MTDLTLPLALVVSVGLTLFYAIRSHHAEKRADRFQRDYNELFDRLEDTEAALRGKVAAEVRGGDGEGPVAA